MALPTIACPQPHVRGDALRVFVRRLLPSKWYRQVSQFSNVAAVIRREDVGTWKLLNHLDGSEITWQFRSLNHPFTFRRVATHIGALVQNVFRREYSHFLTEANPKTVIDAGAFIGDLSCHWATQFPRARIIALEPDPGNFRFAEKNTGPYNGQITLLPFGLWSTCSSLRLAPDEWASRLSRGPGKGDCIPVVDVPYLLERFAIERIDILKMDIEGAEREVFSGKCRWLDRVYSLIIECHGAPVETEVTTRLQSAGFTGRRFRSLLYFTRLRDQ